MIHVLRKNNFKRLARASPCDHLNTSNIDVNLINLKIEEYHFQADRRPVDHPKVFSSRVSNNDDKNTMQNKCCDLGVKRDGLSLSSPWFSLRSRSSLCRRGEVWSRRVSTESCVEERKLLGDSPQGPESSPPVKRRAGVTANAVAERSSDQLELGRRHKKLRTRSVAAKAYRRSKDHQKRADRRRIVRGARSYLRPSAGCRVKRADDTLGSRDPQLSVSGMRS